MNNTFTSSNGTIWTQLNNNYDFFHKVYYDALPVPVEDNVDVGNYSASGWDDGNSYGVLVDDDGKLFLDPKFLTAMVVDDSASMLASYNEVDYQTKIRTLYSTLVTRTTRTVSATSRQFTAADLWTFGTTISEKTKTGFTTAQASVDGYLAALKRKGNNSSLKETLDIAANGLYPQAVIDMLIKEGDTSGNISRATIIKDYLVSISALRLDDLKYRYKTETTKQLNLLDQSIVSAGTVVYLTLNGTDVFTWSSTNYPYYEVYVNNVLRTETTHYTISPSLGKITLTAAISTDALVEVILRQDWNGSASTIPSNEDVRGFMIERWAKSYTPILMAVVDGDNISSISTQDLETSLQTSWNNLGASAYIFGASASNNQINTLPITVGSNGNFFQTNTSTLWNLASAELVHGGDYSLFKGSWSKTFEFDNLTYVKKVFTSFTTTAGLDYSVDSTCVVEFRYSTDKINFTSWITLANNSPYLLKKELTNIEYRISMTEGFNGSTRYTPYVNQLYHTVVHPAERYYFSNTYNTTGSLFEYIFTSNSSIPLQSKLTWAVCKGDSVDWEDYTPIINGRNGVLPNRQNSLQFTNEELYQNLPTTSANQIEYTVLKDGIAFPWTNNALIAVFIDGVAVNASGVNGYTYNASLATITFSTPLFTSQTVTVSVRYPSTRFFASGESTSTVDYKTYFLKNGRWPDDSEIVVLIDNITIARNNYFANREDGTVTFSEEQNHSSLITVFVLPSGKFRLGVKIEDYDVDTANVFDLGFQYTELPNDNLLALYNSTIMPEIKDNLVKVNSTGKSSSYGPNIESRMFLDYEYYSPQGNPEKNTKTKWYRIRSGNTIEITGPNGFPEYQNRTVERLADLNGANGYFVAGDQIYAEVIPSDGFKDGITYTSDTVTLRSDTKPYVTDVQIKSNTIITDTSVAANSILTAYYVFYNGTDASTVNWYEWTNKTSNLIYTGSILPISYVTSGKVISFIVAPYNSKDYGYPIESTQLNIV
jgi:hypothetical protein